MTSSDGHYLYVKAERQDAICMLRIAGELGTGMATAFADQVDAAVRAIPGPVVVDLSGLTSIDAGGARALAAAIRRMRAGRLVTVQSCPLLVRVWELLGLTSDFLPAADRATPQSEIPELVRQVQRTRLDVGQTKLDSRRMLARLTDTCIRLASTQERTGLTLEQGRRTVASSRAAREYVRRSRPGAAI